MAEKLRHLDTGCLAKVHMIVWNPKGIPTRSMENMKWHSPSQVLTAKHVPYPQLTTTWDVLRAIPCTALHIFFRTLSPHFLFLGGPPSPHFFFFCRRSLPTHFHFCRRPLPAHFYFFSSDPPQELKWNSPQIIIQYASQPIRVNGQSATLNTRRV